MRIKLDENLPTSLAVELRGRGHDVDTVRDEGYVGEPDDRVFAAAQAEGRFFMTQDLDFSDIRCFRPGTHAGLLLVRLREPGRQALRARVLELLQSEDLESWKGAFVVATEHKIRITRP